MNIIKTILFCTVIFACGCSHALVSNKYLADRGGTTGAVSESSKRIEVRGGSEASVDPKAKKIKITRLPDGRIQIEAQK